MKHAAIRALSDFLVEAIAIQGHAVDVALMGLIDAAVRVLKATRPSLKHDSATAARELERIVHKIGRAEAGN